MARAQTLKRLTDLICDGFGCEREEFYNVKNYVTAPERYACIYILKNIYEYENKDILDIFSYRFSMSIYQALDTTIQSMRKNKRLKEHIYDVANESVKKFHKGK